MYNQLEFEQKAFAVMQLAYEQGFLTLDRELRRLGEMYLYHGLPYRAAVLMDRAIEDELVPFCDKYNIGILPYYPLENGFLTGKYRRGESAPEGTRLAEGDRGMFTDKNFDTLEGLIAFSEKRGHTVLELAIAWLLANPAVGSVIAGATKAEQVVSNAKASGWHLSQEDMTEIEKILG